MTKHKAVPHPVVLFMLPRQSVSGLLEDLRYLDSAGVCPYVVLAADDTKAILPHIGTLPRKPMVIVLPEGVPAGSGTARDYVMNLPDFDEHTHLLMIDAGVYFQWTNYPWSSARHPLKPNKFPGVVERLREAVSAETPLGTFRARALQNSVVERFSWNMRPQWVYLLHLPTIRKYRWQWREKQQHLPDVFLACALISDGRAIATYNSVLLSRFGNSAPLLTAPVAECRALAEKYSECVTSEPVYDDDFPLPSKTRGRLHIHLPTPMRSTHA